MGVCGYTSHMGFYFFFSTVVILSLVFFDFDC